MTGFEKVTRVEVIDEDGRSYMNYNVHSVFADLQDDDRTLKLFVKSNPTLVKRKAYEDVPLPLEGL